MGQGGLRVGGGECRDDHVFETQVYTQLTPQPPGNHSSHGIEMAKEQGANKPLTQLPALYLFLKQGLELMWESGEPMECGIFDFYKVFSKAFGEEEDGVGESWSGMWGMLDRPDWKSGASW